MSAPAASVVIISYNTRELTLRCLALLDKGRTGDVDYEVVVVDNASADDSADAIAELHPDVHLIRLPDNVGWGRAVNRAVAACTGTYLLLLNPDTRPVGEVVADLVGFARAHPDHLIYTGRTLTADGSDDGYSCWGLPSLWSLLCFATGLSTVFRGRRWANPEGLPEYDRQTVREVPAVSGCLMLVERAFFAELNGFDPAYFLYSEDIDLCVRARARGARPVVFPGAAVVHVVGASSGSESQRVKLLRGKVTYLRQRWPAGRARAGRALLVAGIGLRAAAATILPTRVDWRAIWRERPTWLAGWPTVDEPRPAPADRTASGTPRPGR